jgi:hypothetical protein
MITVMRENDDLQRLDSLDPQRIDFPRVLLQLEELAAHARGRPFEKLVVALLRRDGLEAWHDPGAARPRQTDAGFRLGESFYLVETKWLGRRSGLDDLASVRDRLNRVPAGTAACLVSMGGFTSGLVNDLRERREHEIILIDGDELRAVALGDSFRKLLDEKRRRFRINGEVWFQRDGAQEEPLALPASVNDLVIAGSPAICVAGRTQNCELHFAIDTLQLEMYAPTISVQLESKAEDVQQLEGVISTLHARLRLDGEGSFAIHQTSTSWFGFGARAFIDELQKFRERYAALPSGEHLHHSESASFVSHFDGGWVAVLAQQRVNSESPHLHTTYVEVTMNGIPLDLERLRAAADDIDGRDLQLRVRTADDRYRAAAWLKDSPVLEPIGFVRSTRYGREDEPWVEGLVAKNPFLGRETELEALLPGGRWAYDLAHHETLICWLRSSHCVGDRVDHYRIERIECEQIGSVSRVVIRADWDNVEHCVRGRPGPLRTRRTSKVEAVQRVRRRRRR